MQGDEEALPNVSFITSSFNIEGPCKNQKILEANNNKTESKSSIKFGFNNKDKPKTNFVSSIFNDDEKIASPIMTKKQHLPNMTELIENEMKRITEKEKHNKSFERKVTDDKKIRREYHSPHNKRRSNSRKRSLSRNKEKLKRSRSPIENYRKKRPKSDRGLYRRSPDVHRRCVEETRSNYKNFTKPRTPYRNKTNINGDRRLSNTGKTARSSLRTNCDYSDKLKNRKSFSGYESKKEHQFHHSSKRASYSKDKEKSEVKRRFSSGKYENFPSEIQKEADLNYRKYKNKFLSKTEENVTADRELVHKSVSKNESSMVSKKNGSNTPERCKKELNSVNLEKSRKLDYDSEISKKETCMEFKLENKDIIERKDDFENEPRNEIEKDVENKTDGQNCINLDENQILEKEEELDNLSPFVDDHEITNGNFASEIECEEVTTEEFTENTIVEEENPDVKNNEETCDNSVTFNQGRNYPLVEEIYDSDDELKTLKVGLTTCIPLRFRRKLSAEINKINSKRFYIKLQTVVYFAMKYKYPGVSFDETSQHFNFDMWTLPDCVILAFNKIVLKYNEKNKKSQF